MPICLANRFNSVNNGRYLGLVQGSMAPWFKRLGFVRYDQVKIEIDGVAEALAARTRAVWIVERKQPRLRLLIAEIALLAFEALGKTQPLRTADRRAAQFQK